MSNNSSYSVYILKCSDETLYTGITNNLNQRLHHHILGKASKYTRSRLPIKLVYVEANYTKSDALARERAIKKLSRKQKLQLVFSSKT
ncbi:GIY-YIG nuclease family protein [Desulforamulus aquiferis]|uniref:GIY-YIG nuclease family protein n=1 Tax=Desulforamulus aquiferis TaxID=1397668 RepID=A0AAW7ZEA6_9FIRM|nr:GIY-YIG nuclease family protein [Desulforamulus aquiferis]MDO7787726.1 GIY-YIG nuclease family protein [Desulforamulus aquiferis]RYD03041.1 hypothetical protein N752_21765 [Desulforamulus aquiferis]